MKRVLAGVAAIASLTLGAAAHASCVDPRTSGSGELSNLQQLEIWDLQEAGDLSSLSLLSCLTDLTLTNPSG